MGSLTLVGHPHHKGPGQLSKLSPHPNYQLPLQHSPGLQRKSVRERLVELVRSLVPFSMGSTYELTWVWDSFDLLAQAGRCTQTASTAGGWCWLPDWCLQAPAQGKEALTTAGGQQHARSSMLELSLHCLSESCHDLPDVCSPIGQRLRQTESETCLTRGGLQVKDVLGFALIRSGGNCVLRRRRLQ